MSQTPMGTHDPLEELRHKFSIPEILPQLEASKQILSVSQAIGQDRTKKELVPLISKYCFPEEFLGPGAKEEVLVSLGKHLDKNFYFSVGGGNNWIHHVLPILERLCASEEGAVRTNASESIVSCLPQLSPQDVETHVFPAYKKLSSEEYFPSKVSAAMLTATVYQTMQNEKKRNETIKIHLQLTQDEMPLVRFQSFKNLANIFRVTSHEFYINFGRDLIHAVNQQVPTKHRILLLPTLCTVLEVLPTHTNVKITDIETEIINLLELCAEDPSWQIRLELVKNLEEIVKNFSYWGRQPHVSPIILAWILSFLSDPNSSVRESAQKHLGCYLMHLNCTGFENKILKALFELTSDNIEKIRENSIFTCLDCFEIIDFDKVQLIELINRLKDDESNVVVANICQSLGRITQILGVQYRHVVEEYADQWYEDARWRVRHGIISNMHVIAKELGSDVFDGSIFKQIFIKSFYDAAFTIRQTTCKQLKFICDIFGVHYIEKELLPTVLRCFDNKRNYLHRIVALDAAIELKDVFDQERFRTVFMPILINGLRDKIVNVRITACTAVCQLTMQLLNGNSLALTELRTNLELLLEDEDCDVLHFCKKAIHSLRLVEN